MGVDIVAIIMIFGMPIFIVLIVAFYAFRSYQAKMNLAEKMVEHGVSVPEALLQGKQRNASPIIAKLQSALIWIACGVGSALLFVLFKENRALGFSAIALLIGVAYLIVYFVLKKEEEKERADEKTDDVVAIE